MPHKTIITILLALLIPIPAFAQEVSSEVEVVRQKDFKRHPGVEYGPFLIRIQEIDNAGMFGFRAQVMKIEISNKAEEAIEFDAGLLMFVDKTGKQIEARGRSFMAPADQYRGEPSLILPGATINLRVGFSGSLYLDENIPTKLFYGGVLILQIVK